MMRGTRLQRGSMGVEMALTLPVLLLFLVVITDLGLMLRDHQVITNAAREGARFSALPKNYVSSTNPSASVNTIKQYVVDYCSEEGVTINTSDVAVDQTVTISVSGGVMGASRATVNLTRPTLFLGHFGGSSTVSLRSSSTFANLY